MWFDIYKTTSGYPQKYWWVAKADNHETLCHSEMLSSKRACINAIRVLKDGAASATVYDETGEASGYDLESRRLRV